MFENRGYPAVEILVSNFSTSKSVAVFLLLSDIFDFTYTNQGAMPCAPTTAACPTVLRGSIRVG
jgi:hypothetical protein